MRIKAFNSLDNENIDPSTRERPAIPGGALLVKQTIRSGQRMEHEGDVVVKGDLNPGGEIVATGDIIVLGALRGIAHAGARGNRQAEIVAFTLAPVQLRIAHIISRAPEERAGRQGPVVAAIKGEKIVVERL
jgi:septum site-determining protein MinC